MANNTDRRALILEKYHLDAAAGDAQARYELGVAYSCRSFGLDLDLVEAHKWFNLAALAGSHAGQVSRAELTEEMSAREMIEAQRAPGSGRPPMLHPNTASRPDGQKHDETRHQPAG